MKSVNTIIDILVNNAGIIIRKPAIEHPDEDWDRVIETNLTSHFILTREIGKDMLARGLGKIIFTASMLTFQGGKRKCYCAGLYCHKDHGRTSERPCV